ncbi:unnamed protein product, partial [Pylaiella littoralis]
GCLDLRQSPVESNVQPWFLSAAKRYGGVGAAAIITTQTFSLDVAAAAATTLLITILLHHCRCNEDSRTNRRNRGSASACAGVAALRPHSRTSRPCKIGKGHPWRSTLCLKSMKGV